MSKLKRLIAVNKLSQKDRKWVHRDIFRILNKDEIWIAAYEKLKGTPGSDPKTIERALRFLKNEIRPTSRASYTVLEDHVIVSHYRSLWLGLLNYYWGCTNRGRLQYIHYLFHTSCAMTLGHRHRMSCTKIYKKHRKKLTVKIPHTEKTVSFPYKTKW